MAADRQPAFAVWITGLPASGKSAVARALAAQLAARGVEPAVLESDVLRPLFTPGALYRENDRDIFYRQITWVGELLARHGVSVIFDATANLRRYRDEARRRIPRFLEVYVNTPLEICMARDPKGIYRNAAAGTGAVPGLTAPYEPPEHPDVIVDGVHETPERAASRILAALRERGFLPGE